MLLDGATAVNFDEGQAAGTVVGTLTNNDPDTGDTHAYSLVSCSPDDNYAFSIASDELRAMGPFDYEDDVVLGTDHSFKVCVSVTDPYGLSAIGTFTVNVTDVNEPGQDIQLDNTEVEENQPVGEPVGILSTMGDPDAGDSHIYALPGSPPVTPALIWRPSNRPLLC